MAMYTGYGIGYPFQSPTLTFVQAPGVTSPPASFVSTGMPYPQSFSPNVGPIVHIPVPLSSITSGGQSIGQPLQPLHVQLQQMSATAPPSDATPTLPPTVITSPAPTAAPPAPAASSKSAPSTPPRRGRSSSVVKEMSTGTFFTAASTKNADRPSSRSRGRTGTLSTPYTPKQPKPLISTANGLNASASLLSARRTQRSVSNSKERRGTGDKPWQMGRPRSSDVSVEVYLPGKQSYFPSDTAASVSRSPDIFKDSTSEDVLAEIRAAMHGSMTGTAGNGGNQTSKMLADAQKLRSTIRLHALVEALRATDEKLRELYAKHADPAAEIAEQLLERMGAPALDAQIAELKQQRAIVVEELVVLKNAVGQNVQIPEEPKPQPKQMKPEPSTQPTDTARSERHREIRDTDDATKLQTVSTETSQNDASRTSSPQPAPTTQASVSTTSPTTHVNAIETIESQQHALEQLLTQSTPTEPEKPSQTRANRPALTPPEPPSQQSKSVQHDNHSQTMDNDVPTALTWLGAANSPVVLVRPPSRMRQAKASPTPSPTRTRIVLSVAPPRSVSRSTRDVVIPPPKTASSSSKHSTHNSFATQNVASAQSVSAEIDALLRTGVMTTPPSAMHSDFHTNSASSPPITAQKLALDAIARSARQHGWKCDAVTAPTTNGGRHFPDADRVVAGKTSATVSFSSHHSSQYHRRSHSLHRLDRPYRSPKHDSDGINHLEGYRSSRIAAFPVWGPSQHRSRVPPERAHMLAAELDADAVASHDGKSVHIRPEIPERRRAGGGAGPVRVTVPIVNVSDVIVGTNQHATPRSPSNTQHSPTTPPTRPRDVSVSTTPRHQQQPLLSLNDLVSSVDFSGSQKGFPYPASVRYMHASSRMGDRRDASTASLGASLHSASSRSSRVHDKREELPVAVSARSTATPPPPPQSSVNDEVMASSRRRALVQSSVRQEPAIINAPAPALQPPLSTLEAFHNHRSLPPKRTPPQEATVSYAKPASSGVVT